MSETNTMPPHVAHSESKSVGMWFLSTAYEATLMYVSHGIFDTLHHARQILKFDENVGGYLLSEPFKFQSPEPVTLIASIAAEFIGEGIKSVAGIHEDHFKLKRGDGLGKSVGKFIGREIFEAVAFASILMFVATPPAGAVTMAAFGGAMMLHYGLAASKNMFRGLTDPIAHGVFGKKPEGSVAAAISP